MSAQLALTGVIPAVVAMWYVDRLDAKRPEPARLRRWVVFVGALSVIPALILGTILEHTVGKQIGPAFTYNGAAYHAFLVAAMVEEACKIAVVYWVVWRRPEFDERMDGIVYATRAGLGFAMVENFFYLLGQDGMGSFVTTWVLRALLAVPGHAMWTGMIGAMAARRRFDGKGIGLFGGYLLAVFFHGAYDFCIFVNAPLTLEGRGEIGTLLLAGPLLLTIGAVLVMRRLSRTAAHLDDADALIRDHQGAHQAAQPPWPGAAMQQPWPPGGAMPPQQWPPGGAMPPQQWPPGGAMPPQQWPPGGAMPPQQLQAWQQPAPQQPQPAWQQPAPQQPQPAWQQPAPQPAWQQPAQQPQQPQAAWQQPQPAAAPQPAWQQPAQQPQAPWQQPAAAPQPQALWQQPPQAAYPPPPGPPPGPAVGLPPPPQPFSAPPGPPPIGPAPGAAPPAAMPVAGPPGGPAWPPPAGGSGPGTSGS